MPDYRAPGVYIEEVSFRAKAIERVGTSTVGFVGPTRYGPPDVAPTSITSLAEFERIYGGECRLAFADVGERDNYLWNAVRAFFEEGGTRVHVARVFSAGSTPGFAEAPTTTGFAVRARFSGKSGDARVTFTLALGPNRLVRQGDGQVSLAGAADRDVVWVRDPSGSGGEFRILRRDERGRTWHLGDGGPGTIDELQARFPPALDVLDVRTLTVSVVVEPLGGDLPAFAANDLPLDPAHARSLFNLFADEPASALPPPIIIERPDGGDGLDVLAGLRAAHDAAAPARPLDMALIDPASPPAARSVVVQLIGGNDGNLPTVADYAGTEDPATGRRTGLKALEALEDIAIVAAPGSTEVDDARSRAIVADLIDHAERMRYRIAIVDSVRGQTIPEVRAFRALYDSSHAAFYYPWVRILDPLTGQANIYSPSGFVAGIYARNDIQRAVWKAPANEVVRLALGFETTINKAQQDVLNPEGINCFRVFEGRGMRLWGARTMSSDPEWKYVNMRRYFASLEDSIDRGTRWAVFEPNGERLWANIRRTIEDFLRDEWRNGALLGDTPEQAYFVTCDRSTMTQNDLDNGRMVALIGVAPLRPADFVIFRIGQPTADNRV